MTHPTADEAREALDELDRMSGDDRASSMREQKDARALIAAYITSSSDLVKRLEEEVARCHARLEMDHAFKLGDDDKMVRFEIPMAERSFQADGIECRDDTIKLQAHEIKRLSEKSKAITEQLAEARRLMEPFGRLAENHPMRLKPVWPDLLIGGSCDPTEWNVYGSHFSAVSAFLGVK